MKKYIKILCVVLIFIVLCGCRAKDESYILPTKYTGEAVLKVYTDKSENNYNVKILCRDGNFNLTVGDGSDSWNMACLADNRCILNNVKFPESSVTIENFKLSNTLLYDFDLKKFQSTPEPLPDELVFWDGTYKHVLNFSKENLLPKTIFIYKNDILVKAIQYDKINIEQ